MTPFWDKCVADWVAPRIPGCEKGFGECQAMGVEHGGEIVAGAVFKYFDHKAKVMEIAAAAEDKRWLTRTVLREMFDYVFETAGCQLLFSKQEYENTASRQLLPAFGGTEYVIPRLGGRNRPGTFSTLSDDQWRASRFRR